MIAQPIIDQLNALPIVEVIEHYIKLKKSGANHTACCPFHPEKSSSFSASPAKNIFKCFGCGISGGPIKFVMEYEKTEFVDACKKLGAAHNIQVPEREFSDQEKAIHAHNESLYIVNQFAADYFIEALSALDNIKVMQYASNRWKHDTLDKFKIGFAPDSWDGLLNTALLKGHKLETLYTVGLVAESKKIPGKYYDVFRNRLMIPLFNQTNQIIGFTGRTMGEDKAKYVNTATTPIYTKSNQLYGMNFAHAAIKYHDLAYLVEGNADVIRLHEIGVPNAVAICGTSLTIEQVGSLFKYCSSVTIIPDNDATGVKSIDKFANMIITQGMSCNVLELPLGDPITNDDGKVTGHKKEDADSFFKDLNHFTQYMSANVRDYIVSKAMRFNQLPQTAANKVRAMNEISDLIFMMHPSSHEFYIEQVSRLIKPKKAWTDKIASMAKDSTPAVEKEYKSDIPDHVSLVDWQKYGFYEYKHRYFFRTKEGIVPGCNFTLVPLFHIQSIRDSKRIFRITNEFGLSHVIELPINALISIGRFKEAIESLGNFLWEMGETELNKLKRYLYQETKTCIEITQLGWHKAGFYSWGNGIYNGHFSQVDDQGIATHDDIYYYLPAFSKIWERESTYFMSERNFVHRENNQISLMDYSTRLLKVFGPNASIAICFLIATLFRDVIHRKLNFFPILDLFGPKGAGKTELAVSMMSFFGKMGKGPNVNNTSKAALADHVAQLCNAVVHIDEYKNSIELDKIEFLKGCWDGTGRTRMNMDKDKKKETTPVDCGVILSGQEMPTADIALFSRLIYLTFSQTTYSDQEKKDFNELKAIESLGNTHLTNQILALRKIFVSSFDQSYDIASRDLTRELGANLIEDRIFKNWVIVLAAFHTVRNHLQLPFTYEELIRHSAVQVTIQDAETKKSSEITSFWDIVAYLNADNFIHDGIDYRIELVTSIKTEEMTEKHDFAEPTSLLFIQLSRIMNLYKKHGRQSGEKILPIDSIKYYIKNDPRFLGTKRTRFQFLDTVSGLEGTWSSKPEWAYVLLYKHLGIDLSTSTDLSQEKDKNIDPFTPEVKPAHRPSKFAVPADYTQKKLSDVF